MEATTTPRCFHGVSHTNCSQNAGNADRNTPMVQRFACKMCVGIGVSAAHSTRLRTHQQLASARRGVILGRAEVPPWPSHHSYSPFTDKADPVALPAVADVTAGGRPARDQQHRLFHPQGAEVARRPLRIMARLLQHSAHAGHPISAARHIQRCSDVPGSFVAPFLVGLARNGVRG